MKRKEKDVVKMLADIEDRRIAEAEPEGGDTGEWSIAGGASGGAKQRAAGPAPDGGEQRATSSVSGGGKPRSFRLRLIAGVATVAVAGAVLLKLGLPGPLPKLPSDAGPGKNGAVYKNTSTPTLGYYEPTGTPTPYFPAETPAPTQKPSDPAGTPAPTMTPAPTLTPADPSIPVDGHGELFAPRGEHSLSKAEVRSRDYCRYLSPEIFSLYTYNTATQRDDRGHYEVITFYRKIGGESSSASDKDERNFIIAIVRKPSDAVNCEHRRVSTAETSVYDVAGRDDPTAEKDPDRFYTAANSPIFWYEDFTDAVFLRRIVHHEEDGEEYDRAWFAVEAGDYVIEYLFQGTLTDETSSLFVPGVGEKQLQPEELTIPYDDRQY